MSSDKLYLTLCRLFYLGNGRTKYFGMAGKFDPKALGDRIRAVRVSRNKTQAQVAEASGGAFDQSHFSKIEKGKIPNPGIQTILDIEDALGLPHVDLLLEIAISRQRVDKSLDRFFADYAEDWRITVEEKERMRTACYYGPEDEIPPQVLLKYLEAIREYDRARTAKQE